MECVKDMKDGSSGKMEKKKEIKDSSKILKMGSWEKSIISNKND